MKQKPLKIPEGYTRKDSVIELNDDFSFKVFFVSNGFLKTSLLLNQKFKSSKSLRQIL